MPVNAPRIPAPRLGRRSRSGVGPRTVAAAATSAFGLGALLQYFFDRGAGRRRRNTLRDRIRSKLRRGERRAVTRARRAESRAVGIVRRTLNARHAAKPPADDVALAHHVESELFRRAGVPKGPIDVNAEDGTVFLRGVLERPEDIANLEAVAKRISGVRHVENLLHLPGTRAPASRPKLVRDRDG
jgi:osmotically-inducible protein OsmY